MYFNISYLKTISCSPLKKQFPLVLFGFSKASLVPGKCPWINRRMQLLALSLWLLPSVKHLALFYYHLPQNPPLSLLSWPKSQHCLAMAQKFSQTTSSLLSWHLPELCRVHFGNWNCNCNCNSICSLSPGSSGDECKMPSALWPTHPKWPPSHLNHPNYSGTQPPGKPPKKFPNSQPILFSETWLSPLLYWVFIVIKRGSFGPFQIVGFSFY